MADPASPERPTKRCPDCAEDVLAEARKCRFCGYRFDGAARAAAPAPASGGLAGLLDRVRVVPRTTTTVPQILEEWGVDLTYDEAPEEMRLCEVGGREGFVIVTSARFLFVPTPARARGPQPFDAYPLHELVAVERSVRRGHRSELAVEWWRSRTVFTRLGAEDLAWLEAQFLPHLPGGAAAG